MSITDIIDAQEMVVLASHLLRAKAVDVAPPHTKAGFKRVTAADGGALKSYIIVPPRISRVGNGVTSMQARQMATLALPAGLVVTPAFAQNTDTSVLKLPEAIEFKAAAVPGAPQTAILYGDPTKPGVFVTRVKFSSGWKDMPHWHPDEVRTVAVLTGTFYFASGDRWDESKLKPYPAGTFYSEPPKAPHFTWAKDGEVIIQITGVGPTGKTFIPQQ